MTDQREFFHYCSSCGEPDVRPGSELESQLEDAARQGPAALDDEIDVDELLDEIEAVTDTDRRSP